MDLRAPVNVANAVGGALGVLGRLPDFERAAGDAVRRAQDTLEQILERVGPVEANLDELRESAGRLDSRIDRVEGHLVELERLIDPLEERFRELTEAANRLDGALVHVLDRVPGLSAEDARDRAELPR